MLRIVRQVEFARHDENENSGDECPHSAELTRYLCRKLGVAGYALHCKGGGTIFLFEDRALATGFESAMFRSIAHEFATRASVPLKDLGMIEASAGFVSVWGGRAADWSASAPHHSGSGCFGNAPPRQVRSAPLRLLPCPMYG